MKQYKIKYGQCMAIYSKIFSLFSYLSLAYYYGKKKKRKIGRPPGGHSNLENGPKKPGKRRKRKKVNLMIRKKRASADSDEREAQEVEKAGSEDLQEEVEEEEEEEEFEEEEEEVGVKQENIEEFQAEVPRRKRKNDPDFKPPKAKRKYTHHLPPPSDIKTRGAKLPKYSFERKTHKKIMLKSSDIPPPKPADQKSPFQVCLVMNW